MSLDSTTQHRWFSASLFFSLSLVFAIVSPHVLQANDVTGELKQWHRITVTFDGPQTNEAASKNPFTDYRLVVTFTHTGSGAIYEVPGFFAADGNAAESSATSGNKWRVHFTPDRTGAWTYSASFRTGGYVAVASDPQAGSATSFDGASGNFVVGSSNKGGNDFRGKGVLRYVNGYHLQFAGNGEYFIKVGPDGPENLLAYTDFDGTYDTDCSSDGIDNTLHSYEPHIADWKSGDPSWKGGKGKGLVGAMNYLSDVGTNSIYFLTYNIDGGDGCDVWPWLNENDKERFDVSKLAQWEEVFSHMDAAGIQLHMILSERQNAKSIGGENDGDQLNNIRKLYYRELISRFGHHLAVQWNIGEENTNNNNKRKEFAEYIRSVDPYDHPITVHTSDSAPFEFYDGLLGSEFFEATSLQASIEDYNALAIHYRKESDASGRKWSVYADEQAPNAGNERADLLRKEGLWGNLMGGGAGVEWYFSFDLSLEDFRKFDVLWEEMGYARQFFEEHLPFENMSPNNSLTPAGNDYVFALEGQTYAVYIPDGGSADLQIGGNTGDTFDVWWYNPRAGGALQRGSIETVKGGSSRNLGNPPSDTGSDWVILVKSGSGTIENQPPVATISVDVSTGVAPLVVAFDGGASSDPDGSIVSYEWDFGDGSGNSGVSVSKTFSTPGTYHAVLTVTDDEGLSDSAEEEIIVTESGGGGGGGPLPVASIKATDIDAAEPGGKGNNAKFRIDLSESVQNEMTVHFNIAGTAAEGQDYEEVGATIVVDAGDDFEKVLIYPIDDDLFESDETVVITLLAGSGYEIDPDKNSATVTIFDDETSVSTEPIYRVNAGGGGVSDASLSWHRDTKNKPSAYVNAEEGDNRIDKETFVGVNNTDAPTEIFDRSRWDPAGNEPMLWSFPVDNGTYQVRLFFAETSEKNAEKDARRFDVLIENKRVLDDYDVVQDVGFQTATMKSFTTTVSDGILNIEFDHVVENPFVNGIEILPSQKVTAGGPGGESIPTIYSYDQLGIGDWDMIGLPLATEIDGLMHMQPAPELFAFSGKDYLEIESIKTGQGMWFHAMAEQRYRFEGQRLDSLTTSISEGWNIISGPSCATDFNRIVGMERLVPHSLYRYDEGYVKSRRVEQGRGYWVYADEAGSITLSCASGTPVEFDPMDIDMKPFGEIVVRDAGESEQSLYFGNQVDADMDRRAFLLPPEAPGMGLDVRFTDNSWLLEAMQGQIQVLGGVYPLEVEIGSLPESATKVYVLSAMQGQTAVNAVRVRKGDVVVLERNVDRLLLQSVDDYEAGLPASFELAGNYPNPFNPETSIVFGLPDRAEVEVDIFDMLGRRVKSMDRRTMEAGPRQEIRISAGDLASGTYLYQVKATIGRRLLVESGTMTLLK